MRVKNAFISIVAPRLILPRYTTNCRARAKQFTMTSTPPNTTACGQSFCASAAYTSITIEHPQHQISTFVLRIVLRKRDAQLSPSARRPPCIPAPRHIRSHTADSDSAQVAAELSIPSHVTQNHCTASLNSRAYPLKLRVPGQV